MKAPPVACTLSPQEMRTRLANLLPGLAARADQLTSVPDGVRLRLPPAPDALAEIARVVDAERHCCRFLAFTITAEPDLGPITVTVTAPPEAQAMLRDLVGGAPGPGENLV